MTKIESACVLSYRIALKWIGLPEEEVRAEEGRPNFYAVLNGAVELAEEFEGGKPLRIEPGQTFADEVLQPQSGPLVYRASNPRNSLQLDMERGRNRGQ